MTHYGNCNYLHSVSSKLITYWHQTQLCAKRTSHPETYKDYLETAVKKGERCRSGYKQCGVLDTLEQLMCIEESKECPINDIQINRQPSINASYTSIPFAGARDKIYLHFSNQFPHKKIISKLVVNEGDLCVNPIQTNKQRLYIRDYYYKDNTCSFKIGEHTLDPRYEIIDASKKQQLYTDNSLMQYYEEARDFNPSLFDIDINLLVRPYIGLDKQCLLYTKFSLEKFSDSIHTHNTGYKLEIANMVFISIQFVLMAVCVFFRVVWQYQISSSWNWSQYLQIFIALIHFILTAITWSKFDSINMMFPCGDEITNIAMSLMTKIYERAVIFNGIACFVSLFIIILYLSDFVIDNVLTKSSQPESVIPPQPTLNSSKPPAIGDQFNDEPPITNKHPEQPEQPYVSGSYVPNYGTVTPSPQQ